MQKENFPIPVVVIFMFSVQIRDHMLCDGWIYEKNIKNRKLKTLKMHGYNPQERACFIVSDILERYRRFSPKSKEWISQGDDQLG